MRESLQLNQSGGRVSTGKFAKSCKRMEYFQAMLFECDSSVEKEVTFDSQKSEQCSIRYLIFICKFGYKIYSSHIAKPYFAQKYNLNLI